MTQSGTIVIKRWTPVFNALMIDLEELALVSLAKVKHKS